MALFRRGHVFGIAAIHAITEHGVAAAKTVLAGDALRALPAAQSGREQHAPAGLYALAQFAHAHYFARDVAAQHVRHVELHAGNAAAHEKVQMIERAGAYPQQDFIGFDLGLGSVFVDQHFRAAMLVDACDFHAVQRINCGGMLVS